MVEMVQDFTKDEPGMTVPTAPPEYFFRLLGCINFEVSI